jgi:hypothetical protein
MATRGAQRIRRYASETNCCARIHDREHDIALINEPRNRANICYSRVARERARALAAALQPSVNIQALRFQLKRYRLTHVTRAHYADTLDLHFSTRLVWFETAGGSAPKVSRPAEGG